MALLREEHPQYRLLRLEVPIEQEPSGAEMGCRTVSDLVLHKNKEVTVNHCLCVDNNTNILWR